MTKLSRRRCCESRRLSPRKHVSYRGRVPLPAPRRLDPARIEGIREKGELERYWTKSRFIGP